MAVLGGMRGSTKQLKICPIPAGTRAQGVKPPVKGGYLRLQDREWQVEAFEKLRGEHRRRLLAPTGAGKSTAIRAMLLDDLKRGCKVIVAVPQVIIGQTSFKVMKLELPSGERVEWVPAHFLVDKGQSTISTIEKFVSEPAGPTPASRILVCTHASLVRAAEAVKGRWGKAGPISLCIDEAHFVNAEERDEDSNGLGLVVSEWLDRDPGPLTLVTATWCRGDLYTIIPKQHLQEFSSYYLTADRHLASMNHLKEIVFTYMMGSLEDAVKTIYEKDRKGMVFIRPTRPNEPPDLKKHRVGQALKAFGTYKAGEFMNTHSYQGRCVRSLDLVDEKYQDLRKTRFLSAMESPAAHEPDMVVAIHIGKLGFDWPKCDLVLIEGKRNSYPDMIQRAGRCLRDVEGKVRAEVVILLPPIEKGEADYEEKLKGYLKTLLASLVIEWQFRSPNLTGYTPKQKEAVQRFREDPDLGVELLSKVADAHIEGMVGLTEDSVIDKVAGDLFKGRFDEEEIRGVSNYVKNELKTADDVPMEFEFDKSVAGRIQMYSRAFDCDILTTLRKELELRGSLPLPDLKNLSRELKRRGIRTQKEYDARYTEIPGAPRYPNRAYGDEWLGWEQFLCPVKNAYTQMAEAHRNRKAQRRGKLRGEA